jgi:hypothetical protein
MQETSYNHLISEVKALELPDQLRLYHCLKAFLLTNKGTGKRRNIRGKAYGVRGANACFYTSFIIIRESCFVPDGHNGQRQRHGQG